MTKSVKGQMPITATNTPFNAISFMIESQLKGLINTALPVRVDSVDPAGFVAVTPLITQKSGSGEAIDPQQIPKIPYIRLQGGKAAIVIDPKPNDIGVAIFAQQDISNIRVGQKAPVTPGSFRSFDVSDGIYLGGILNEAPEVFLEFNQNGSIKIAAKTTLTLEAPNITIAGNLNVNGDLKTTNDLIAGGTSLKTHIHGNVQAGGNQTSPPL